MSGERVPLGVTMASIIRILLVDGDPTYLPITTSMLQLFDFQVYIAKNPLEALSLLRLYQTSLHFDIVLTDLQMSMMNALEFRKLVDQKFHIPVILMSGEHKRSVLFKGLLQNGLPFFIDKPPSADDLMNLRQYVISRRRERDCLNNMKRKLLEEDYDQVEESEELNYITSNEKRPKLVWTNELHNKFLKAINAVGFHRAVPKKILQYMNVPGLTRENVASHLQKYRVYLKRLCKSSSSTRSRTVQNWNDNLFRSTFSWPQFSNVATNNSLPYNSNPNNLVQQARGQFSNVASNNSLPYLSNPNNLGQRARGPFSNVATNYSLTYSSNPINFGQQARGQFSYVATNNALPYHSNLGYLGQQTRGALPSMYANNGVNTGTMPIMGSSFGAFQGSTSTMLDTLPSNDDVCPVNILESSNASNVVELTYFTGETNDIQESFMPVNVQNNSNPNVDHRGYLADVTNQFLSSPDQPTSNLGDHNQGQTHLLMMTQMGGGAIANEGDSPGPNDQYGGLLLNDSVNDMITNGNMTFPVPEQGNQNVHSTILIADEDDGLENFISSLELESLNYNNQTSENPFMDQQDETMPLVDNCITTDHEMPVQNISNSFPLVQNDVEQEMSNSGISSGSPVIFQDWAAGNTLDDFYLDGIDDLVDVFSSFDGDNGSNNLLP